MCLKLRCHLLTIRLSFSFTFSEHNHLYVKMAICALLGALQQCSALLLHVKFVEILGEASLTFLCKLIMQDKSSFFNLAEPSIGNQRKGESHLGGSMKIQSAL